VADSAETQEATDTPDVVQAGRDSDSEDDLFGNMLEEPDAGSVPVEQPVEPENTIRIRSMPVPKSFAFSGNIPKAMLKAALAKTSKPASVSYIKLSGYSRVVRVGLEISWTSERRRVWKMDEIACDDLIEAENYVATLALSELSGRGEIGGVNWRAMPPDYRELWEELETQRAEEVKVEKRQFWAKIRELSSQQVSEPPPSATLDKAIKPESIANTSTPSGIETPISERLQADFARRQSAPSYQAMLPQRQSLPIASFRQQIIDTLEDSQIVVLSGETGCGKSTQLPAYILEDQLAKGKACKIYVTEPRRISAISLAQRVSQELGERKGSVGSTESLVGYSIRMEAKVSSNTRLAFVTNGIALRMLESGSAGRGTAFDQVTHIIVDEVHERSIDSDFLLIVLKQLVQQRPDLKVVLMSATLDAEKISAFFGGCPTLSVPGRTFPVTVNHLEDAVELTGYHIDETSPYAVRSRFAKSNAKQLEHNDDADSDGSDSEGEQDPTKLSSSKYSASTVSTVNLLDSRQIPYDLVVRLLEAVCIEKTEYRPFSAAILVFMPGLAEIRKLNELLQTHGHFGSAEYVIFPLHSTISSEGQGAVFDIPSRGVRKIVICESYVKSDG
jgi:ATP-dependent RNA helicase DHX29